MAGPSACVQTPRLLVRHSVQLKQSALIAVGKPAGCADLSPAAYPSTYNSMLDTPMARGRGCSSAPHPMSLQPHEPAFVPSGAHMAAAANACQRPRHSRPLVTASSTCTRLAQFSDTQPDPQHSMPGTTSTRDSSGNQPADPHHRAPCSRSQGLSTEEPHRRSA